MTAASLIAERDTYRSGSPDWDALNHTAWRVYRIEMGGAVGDMTPPPEDFGPHYLQFMEAAE